MDDKQYLVCLFVLLSISIVSLLLLYSRDDRESYNKFSKRILVIDTVVNSDLDTSIKLGINIEKVNATLSGTNDWMDIGNVISSSSGYEGVVVLYKPETIAYLSCALSFMLKNIDKPVVVCIEQDVNTAIKVVKSTKNPLVMMLYNNLLYLGSRTTSPIDVQTSLPIGSIKGDKVILPEEKRAETDEVKPFNFLPIKNSQTALVKLFPSITSSVLDKKTNVRAIVLESDNEIPHQSFVDKVDAMSKNGIVFIKTTKSQGITPECAFVKLNFILTNVPNANADTIMKLMAVNMRGEMGITDR